MKSSPRRRDVGDTIEEVVVSTTEPMKDIRGRRKRKLQDDLEEDLDDVQDQVVIQLMIMGIIRSSTIISSSCYLFDHLDNSRCLVWSEDSGVKVTVIVITILS